MKLVLALTAALCFLSGSVSAWKFGAQASACPPAATFAQRDVVTTPSVGSCPCTSSAQSTYVQRSVVTTQEAPVILQQQLSYAQEAQRSVVVQRDVTTTPVPALGYGCDQSAGRLFAPGLSYGGYAQRDFARGFDPYGGFGRGTVVLRDQRFFNPVFHGRGFRDVVPVQPIGPVVVTGGSTLEVRRGLFGSRTRATGAAAEIAAANTVGRRGFLRR